MKNTCSMHPNRVTHTSMTAWLTGILTLASLAITSAQGQIGNVGVGDPGDGYPFVDRQRFGPSAVLPGSPSTSLTYPSSEFSSLSQAGAAQFSPIVVPHPRSCQLLGFLLSLLAILTLIFLRNAYF